MNRISPLSRLALLQCLVIFTGVLTTCGALRFHGSTYDPTAIRWNPVALAVREAGWLLVVLPVLWTTACVVLERRMSIRWSRSWSVASGLLLLALLIGLLWWTTFTPVFFQKMPLRTW